MTKKRRTKPGEPETTLPKFEGWNQLAALKDVKIERPQQPPKSSPTKAAPRQTAPKPRESPRATSADDDLTFHRLMSGVVPLEGGVTRIPVTSEESSRTSTRREGPKELREKAKAEAANVLEHLHHLVDDVARFEVTDDGRRVEGRRADVAPSVLRSLRRGLLPVDARLDLHGSVAEEARDRLIQFLRDKRARGERCVLVIHGKGEGTRGAGVLRGEIAAWLSQGRAREHVAAFATACNEDGGEGAVYVALRRG